MNPFSIRSKALWSTKLSQLYKRPLDTLFYLMCTLFFLFLVFIFYVHDEDYEGLGRTRIGLRNALENNLYDLRMNLRISARAPDTKVATVTIDNDFYQGRGDAEKFNEFQSLVFNILRNKPKAIAIVEPFDFKKAEYLEQLATLIRSDQRLIYGSLNKNELASQTLVIEQPFVTIQDRIFSTMTYPIVRGRPVRTYWLASYPGPRIDWHLAPAMAIRYSDKRPGILTKNEPYIREVLVNYYLPEVIQNIQAKAIKDEQVPALEGKYIFLGTANFQNLYRESNFVKTPLASLNTKFTQVGIPNFHMQANFLSNLLNNNWLRRADGWVNVLQSILLVFCIILIWRQSFPRACLSLSILFTALFVAHILLLSFLGFYVPMADTLLFGLISILGGGLWRSRMDGKERAIQAARTESQMKLAATNARLLKLFSKETITFNRQIKENLASMRSNLRAVKAREIIDRALQSCESLDEYLMGVQHLIGISDQRKLPIKISNFSLKKLVELILSRFQQRASENSIQLENTLKNDHFVNSDRGLVEQILINFLSNAIKYSPEGSTVTVSCTENLKGRVTISVQDRGKGISEHHQNLIFQKFYRVKDDTVYSTKGNGLGLYLSQFFADKIGAKIELHSQLNQGSTFSLNLFKKGKRY